MKTLLTILAAVGLSLPAFANDNADDLKTLSSVRIQNQIVNVYLKDAINEATIAILDNDES